MKNKYHNLIAKLPTLLLLLLSVYSLYTGCKEEAIYSLVVAIWFDMKK